MQGRVSQGARSKPGSRRSGKTSRLFRGCFELARGRAGAASSACADRRMILSLRCMTFRRLHPSSIHPPFAHYAHGVEVPAGARLVFCSGQLGIDPGAKIPEDAEAQAGLCFAAIAAILAEAGMTLADVIRLNAYVSGREHLAAYMASRDRHMGEALAASTLMIVSGFAREVFKVEVEAIAGRKD